MITDLDAVETESADGRVTIDLSTDQWRALVGSAADYTRRLAEANQVEASERRDLELRPDRHPISDLRGHLEIQRRIFALAA